jgi:hypothetical protein
MKLIIFLSLIFSFSVKAQVFDPSLSVALSTQTVCLYNSPTGFGDPVPASVWYAYVQDKAENRYPDREATRSGRFIYNYYGNGCERAYYYSLIAYNTDENGDETDVVDSSFSALPATRFDTAQACEQQESTMSYSYQSGDRCYQPQILNDRDSCNDSGTAELTPANSGDPSSACLTKTDGSICSADLIDINGHSVYENRFENSCYETSAPPLIEESFVPLQPNNGGCEATRTGFLACEGTDETIDNNGFDANRYCGTYDIGNGDTAVCFDKDSDGDGLNDSSDPDIDNDNILNNDDSDHDGDSISNETDTDYTNSTGSGSGGSGGETGGDGDTGSGDGDTVVNVDLSGVEQRLDNLKEVLLETSGIPSSDDIDTGLESIGAELINDTKTEMAKGIGETCIDGSCGTALDGTETDFIETVFGTFQAAECNNPTWLSYSLDFCSKAPLINEFLYWIIALLTVVGLWEEFHKVTRRKT